jgi:hypothetical protein
MHIVWRLPMRKENGRKEVPMAQFHLRNMQFKFLTPLFFGASFSTAVTDGINTAVVLLIAALLLITNLRFFRLLKGERKLKKEIKNT